ncbi:MAG: alanine:cation symporter family protein [Erysipelotrichaceae bacterium]|nr:alanine:cation symporter family protein [Erysipelotrichaceae bacterium]
MGNEVASTTFVEATLAQLYKQKDPLYGGYRGGPACYIHQFFTKGKKRYSIIAILFALSALLCWGGVSQVISFLVTSAFGV